MYYVRIQFSPIVLFFNRVVLRLIYWYMPPGENNYAVRTCVCVRVRSCAVQRATCFMQMMLIKIQARLRYNTCSAAYHFPRRYRRHWRRVSPFVLFLTSQHRYALRLFPCRARQLTFRFSFPYFLTFFFCSSLPPPPRSASSFLSPYSSSHFIFVLASVTRTKRLQLYLYIVFFISIYSVVR